ncbi:putative dual-specificity RNA methyltransferase RlmN OS=Streptomyces alboniger OX=132473 GN=rlmN PE=3 SV=1 [Streptomyces alboniger]
MSTVGLVPAIHRFYDEGFKCRLAISLHAPDDELRDTLVPDKTRWQVREVLDAGWESAAKSGRCLVVEYALSRVLNDPAWRGDRLGRLLKGKPVHVNLIPLNPTPGSKWYGLAARGREGVRGGHRRPGWGPGDDAGHPGPGVDGACGQLAAAER